MKDLKKKLLAENEIEAIALSSGVYNLKEILSTINRISPVTGLDSVLSADLLMKKHEKITFM